jgi:hypothetical protein
VFEFIGAVKTYEPARVNQPVIAGKIKLKITLIINEIHQTNLKKNMKDLF